MVNAGRDAVKVLSNIHMVFYVKNEHISTALTNVIICTNQPFDVEVL